MIPQILFSGVVVKFDQLNYKVGDQDKVPFIGEVMASRWAFEALTVKQFNDNEYQRNFTEINTLESVNRINLFYIIPMVTSAIEDYNSKTDNILRSKDIKLIKAGLLILDLKKPSSISDEALIKTVKFDLEQKRKQVSSALDKIRFRKDNILEGLAKKYRGEVGVNEVKLLSVNKAVSDLVLNRSVADQVIQVESEIFIKSDPVFRLPQSRIGRAHFFASFKRIGGYVIETYWFNLTIIWLMIFLLYIMLIFQLLTKFAKGSQQFFQLYFKNSFRLKN